MSTIKPELYWKSRFPWVAAFAVTMGIFEAALVVYLRAISYPDGFGFPLSPIPMRLLISEVLREFASLVMITSVAVLSGRSKRERFAGFLIIFGIWDIVYYLFLLLLLGWPPSLFTWDVLFLIPVLWSAPVITPVLVSCAMMFIGYRLIANPPGENEARVMDKHSWLLLFASAVVLFASFVWDYLRFVFDRASGSFLEAADNLIVEYVPVAFPWFVYGAGLALSVLAGIYTGRRKKLGY